MSKVFNLGDVVLPGVHPKIGSFARFAPPVTTALVGAYVLGGNAVASVRNRAGGPPLSVVGAPTIGSEFGARLDHDNCFDTGLAPSASRTWIVVAKPQSLTGSGAANKASLLGNHTYVSSNLRGDQMWMGNPSAFYNQADINGPSPANVAQVVSALDPAKWAALVGTVDSAAGVMDCARRQSGVRTWVNPTTGISGRATYSDKKVRIGGDGTGTPGIYAHNVDIGLVLMHGTALSRAEIDTQLDYISQWLASTFGIDHV